MMWIWKIRGQHNLHTSRNGKQQIEIGGNASGIVTTTAIAETIDDGMIETETENATGRGSETENVSRGQGIPTGTERETDPGITIEGNHSTSDLLFHNLSNSRRKYNNHNHNQDHNSNHNLSRSNPCNHKLNRHMEMVSHEDMAMDTADEATGAVITRIIHGVAMVVEVATEVGDDRLVDGGKCRLELFESMWCSCVRFHPSQSHLLPIS